MVRIVDKISRVKSLDVGAFRGTCSKSCNNLSVLEAAAAAAAVSVVPDGDDDVDDPDDSVASNNTKVEDTCTGLGGEGFVLLLIVLL